MLGDKNNQVSTAQTVTATAVSTDSIDLLAAKDLGTGREIYMTTTVDQLVDAVGAATVTFQAIVADDAALTTNVTVVGATDAIGKASLGVGSPLRTVKLNPSFGSLGRRYLGARYVVATGPLTSGQFTTKFGLLPDAGTQNYPIGQVRP